jgi:hypothetical protein
MTRRGVGAAVVPLALVVLVTAVSAAPPLAHPSRLAVSDRAKFTLDPKYSRLESGGVFLLPRTCHLQMQYMLSTDGYTHFGTFSQMPWDWNHLPTTIKFQWHDTNPRTVSVAWQVSMMPFGDSPKNWQQPPGLVASGTSAKAADTTTFGIDFAKFAPLPPKQGAQRLALPARRLGAISPLPAGAKPPARLSPQAQTMATVSALRMMQLFGPMSLQVRVVPLDGRGAPQGFASQPIEVLWGPQPSGPPINFSGMTPPPAVHPVVKIAAYTPIKWAEGVPYHLLCVKDIGVGNNVFFHKGVVYDFTPRPKNETPWEQVLGFIKQSLDGWSLCYQMLQDCITYVVSYAFYQVDPTLGDGVRAGAQVALIAGMAALGLPPALPNYDQLVGLGEDYLVQCAAEQVGVPPEDAKQAVDLIKDQLKSDCQGGGDPSVFWVHAPDYCYRPSFLTLAVTNPGTQPTTPLDLVVSHSVYTPPWKDVGDITGYYYPDGLQSQQVFSDRTMHLPALRPGQTLVVPIFLKETYDVNKETQSVSDAVAWTSWAWGYHRQQSVTVSTRLVNPAKSGPDNLKAQDQMSWVPDAPR